MRIAVRPFPRGTTGLTRSRQVDGCQVAPHTWILSAITRDQRRDEIVKLEMALRNFLGDDCVQT
jgi:hypothetical protein